MNVQAQKPEQIKEKPNVVNQPEQTPIQEPADQNEAPVIGNEKGGAIPYLFAWLLGVPVSLLLLVALFRAVFK